MEDLSSTIGPLIEKATDPHNPLTNTTAVVEFCNVLNKEPNCANLASRVLALKLQSPYEWEALQALNLLDTCMKCCGPAFHAEVGKFRFLNEMIKLVSPKYLGNRTHPQVKSKVIELMHSWTNDYPKETKIKEAYDMLKKQGVVKEENHREDLSNSTLPPSSTTKTKSSIFQDDERSRLLQKLLQSKNPDDLQAANRLIKTMVKEDERRVEMNSRRMNELESVHNNTRLLNEMLDNYKPGQASPEDLELIKELHQTCEGLRPKIVRLASETQDNEAMLNEVLSANDELGQVFEKYTLVIIHGRSLPDGGKLNENLTSLLDLSTPSEEKLPPVEPALLGNQLQGLELNNEKSDSTASSTVQTPKINSSNLEILGDIFTVSPPNNEKSEVKNILQPVTISHVSKSAPQADEDLKKTSKVKALEDLDVLGETLLKQNLPSHLKTGNSFPRTTQKIPMNQLSKITQEESLSGIHSENNSKVNIDFLIGSAVDVTPSTSALTMDLLNGDDSMVDLNEDFEESPKSDTIQITNSQIETNPVNNKENEIASTKNSVKKIDVKPLNDINITLESIKPSSIPPLTVLDEKNGISVILHFAENSPRPDVSVIVITTISKNPSPLKDYLFQAVVPKACKLRLQSSSGTSLPGYTPFLPPSAITQIMLIANPNKEEISLKFMISYSLEEETITEMGEVEKLPLII